MPNRGLSERAREDVEDALSQQGLPGPGLRTRWQDFRRDLNLFSLGLTAAIFGFIPTAIILTCSIVALGYGVDYRALPLMIVGVVLLIWGLMSGLIRASEIFRWGL